MRGEHADVAIYGVPQIGSSPRARGTQPCRLAPDVQSRFIPACAGNTQTLRKLKLSTAVHPRVRGEHFQPCLPWRCAAGSSPRARGTLSWFLKSRVGIRFIPACAGNTKNVPLLCNLPSVHPRVRGEHWIHAGRPSEADGSSPRARGTPFQGRGCRQSARFIPACAGNTSASMTPTISASVHPRVRGEHPHQKQRPDWDFGSSPRARGTLLVDHARWVGARFIPACAGNTRGQSFCTTCWPVHPRVRGEHTS